MEAKDTVMKRCGHIHCEPKCHEVQAEISFKAGIKEGIEYVVSGKYMECENLKELSSD